MGSLVRAYSDLLRLQFFFAWPLLFSSGYLLAAATYGGFSLTGLLTAALIGFFGFEAGFVLNDYVDRDYDCKDVENDRLTRYWRLFGTRPIPAGLIRPGTALLVFCVLAAVTAALAATLPLPHSLYVLALMAVCYALEVFYQRKKRKQGWPAAQLAGRIDFALFPVAGYLCLGNPDITAGLYFAFFYPFALAHLGINDLIDVVNDRARGMFSVPVLLGEERTIAWISGFTALHVLTAVLFATRLGWIAWTGFGAGLLLLLVANVLIRKYRNPEIYLTVLPCFHLAMIFYAGSIALDSVW